MGLHFNFESNTYHHSFCPSTAPTPQTHDSKETYFEESYPFQWIVDTPESLPRKTDNIAMPEFSIYIAKADKLIVIWGLGVLAKEPYFFQNIFVYVETIQLLFELRYSHSKNFLLNSNNPR